MRRLLGLADFWFSAALAQLARGRMYAYYTGMATVGALGFVGDPSPGLARAIGYTATQWTFSTGMIVLAVLAIVARKMRAAEAEAAFVIGMGVTTFIHGTALISTGVAGWQSGVRLAIALLMMWDWADYRRRDRDFEQLVSSVEKRFT